MCSSSVKVATDIAGEVSKILDEHFPLGWPSHTDAAIQSGRAKVLTIDDDDDLALGSD